MKYFAILISVLFCYNTSFSQDSTLKMRTETMKAKSLADTSRFIPNVKSGWSLFNSYLTTVSKDSVLLEATVSHSRDIDWKEYQLFGRIKDRRLIPGQEQEIKYYLLTDGYVIKVDVNGNVYIKISEGGQLPGGDPIVLPVTITFKGK